MEPWIWISIAAAAFQTLRFMLQKKLVAADLTATGATFSRFVFAAPVMVVMVPIYLMIVGAPWPTLTIKFWVAGLTGGLAQILATVAVVALFSSRNFAVGITFKKTEVIMTAIVGFVILGDVLSFWACVALLIGLLGVLFLSDTPGGTGSRRFFNRAAGLGLTSGVFFAISAVGYRAATLEVPSSDPLLRAGMTVAAVNTAQALGLAAWLSWRSPGQISQTFRSWRTTGLVGLTSLGGSYCWFLAFTLQAAALVFAVGQIEVIFSFLIGVFVFRETSTRRELIGIGLLTLSIVALVLLG